MTDQQATYDTDNGRQASVMPIADAARALGVSERTIWRRVKSGKLQTIDMNGKTCVQVTMAAQPVTQPAENGTLTGKTTDNGMDEIKQLYRERIAYLEDENSRLWSEIHAKQATIDNLTRMLPAPAQTSAVTEKPTQPQASGKSRGTLTTWAIIILAAIGLAVVLSWALGFIPLRQQAEPVRHTPVIRKIPHTAQGPHAHGLYHLVQRFAPSPCAGPARAWAIQLQELVPYAYNPHAHGVYKMIIFPAGGKNIQSACAWGLPQQTKSFRLLYHTIHTHMGNTKRGNDFRVF